ncbi:unnamed protein product [Ambrosiozyma monospora]|uniref:Unnamed protein product n=1 Tax=Ambrosiozyma monospora TaxID=43982 RepID=A0A9W6YU82_AMBMO|nr:unnamed protein product [Ambrosiozyma monospora]
MREAIGKTEQVVKNENGMYKCYTVLLTSDDIKQIIQTVMDCERIDEKDAFFMKWTYDQWNKLARFSIKQAEKYEQSDSDREPKDREFGFKSQDDWISEFMMTADECISIIAGTKLFSSNSIRPNNTMTEVVEHSSLRTGTRGHIPFQSNSVSGDKLSKINGTFTDTTICGKKLPYRESADGEKEWRDMAYQMGCDFAQVQIMMIYIQDQLKKKDLKPTKVKEEKKHSGLTISTVGRAVIMGKQKLSMIKNIQEQLKRI